MLISRLFATVSSEQTKNMLEQETHRRLDKIEETLEELKKITVSLAQIQERMVSHQDQVDRLDNRLTLHERESKAERTLIANDVAALKLKSVTNSRTTKLVDHFFHGTLLALVTAVAAKTFGIG